ncbi:MAG: hypothetical protein ACM3O6_06070 [Acidobacteriota bacterium]
MLERIAERAAGQGWWDIQALAGAAALAAEERAGIGEQQPRTVDNVVPMRR